jgi:LmbE family N-acetylglucosaminyl deacetylase
MSGVRVGDRSDLVYMLKRLGNVATVLHLGAHPDDEDSGLLVYVSRKLGGRVVYWSATRGEGGQNIVNSYRDKALGLFRTWESLSAREIDGGECLFGPFIDFGFSKNARDTFAKWNRENMLREVVRAIRMVQPQVVVSRWAGTSEDGHGHHQAVGKIVLEAFDLAGDPGYLPQLFDDGLPPWQSLKLYRSGSGLRHLMGAGQGVTTVSPPAPFPQNNNVLTINTGEFDPADGRTFQERAWHAMNCHQTQGMGFCPSPGDFYYHFFQLKSLVPLSSGSTDIFTGFDPALTGLADLVDKSPDASEFVMRQLDSRPDLRETLALVKQRVAEAIDLYAPDDPFSSTRPLLDGLSVLRNLLGKLFKARPVGYRKSNASGRFDIPYVILSLRSILIRKINEFEKAIARCLGLRLQCLCTRRKLTPGESLFMAAQLWNHGNITIDKTEFRIRASEDWRIIPVDDFGNLNDQQRHLARYEVFAGEEAKLSCPYWLDEPHERYMYRWPNSELAQQPFGPAPVQAECRIVMGEHHLTLRQPALHRTRFAGGYKELSPAVVPPISLHPESSKKFVLLRNVEQWLKISVVTRCMDDERPAAGHLELQVPEGWQVNPSSTHVLLEQGGGAQTCTFRVRIPPGTPQGYYNLVYRIRCRNRHYGVVLFPVRKAAPGLPAIEDESTCINEEFLLSPSTLVIHIIDARFLTDQSYAYVEGAKEEIVDTLASLGVAFQRLSDYDIAHEDLSQFHTIVIGPNAYILRHSLKENAFRFLEYVKNGGTLVVQYQRYEYEQTGLAPYPIKYNRPHDRVTDERAPVTILRPESALFQLPNLISPGDFEGWIHDRGLYFLNKWDNNYLAYLSCVDPGEAPKEGGLVGCRFGNGNFLYVGYSLFRQISEGVPGAFKLFSNMLALGCEGSKL